MEATRRSIENSRRLVALAEVHSRQAVSDHEDTQRIELACLVLAERLEVQRRDRERCDAEVWGPRGVRQAARLGSRPSGGVATPQAHGPCPAPLFPRALFPKCAFGSRSDSGLKPKSLRPDIRLCKMPLGLSKPGIEILSICGVNFPHGEKI